MTFNKHVCTETRELLEEYKQLKKWSHSSRRRKIKQRIYEIELPLIRAKLSSIKDIDEKICTSEYSRIFANTAEYLFSSKKFNSKKFDKILNPSSKKNASERGNIQYLYELLTNEHASYKAIDKVLKQMSIKEKTAFEHICEINLEVFDYMIRLDKKH